MQSLHKKKHRNRTPVLERFDWSSGPTQEEAEKHGNEAILKLRFLTSQNRPRDLTLAELGRKFQALGASEESNIKTLFSKSAMETMTQRLRQKCTDVMSRGCQLTLSLSSAFISQNQKEEYVSMQSAATTAATSDLCLVFWGSRIRPYVRLPNYIKVADPADLCGATDYSMMLKILWDDYATNKYKYIAIMAAEILISSLDVDDYKQAIAKNEIGNGNIAGMSLYRLHLADVDLLLDRKAMSDVTLDIYLKLLWEEGVQLLDLFYHEEISPYFLFLSSVVQPSELMLALYPDKICEDARRKLLWGCQESPLGSRFSEAISTLQKAGIVNHLKQ